MPNIIVPGNGEKLIGPPGSAYSSSYAIQLSLVIAPFTQYDDIGSSSSGVPAGSASSYTSGTTGIVYRFDASKNLYLTLPDTWAVYTNEIVTVVAFTDGSFGTYDMIIARNSDAAVSVSCF